MSFDGILSRIANGQSVPPEELLPYLCLERREERAHVNMRLARAFRESGRAADLEQARVFVRRAWLLGRFPADLLPLYTDIHAALDDIEGIRAAYKRAGIIAAARGDLDEVARCFDQWQYAYISHKRLDRYEYDFDFLEALERLAAPYQLAPRPRPGLLNEGKIRIAYLVQGITEVGSVLVKLNLLFARFHDRSRFEPVFFVPEMRSSVLASEVGREYLEQFEAAGCRVVMARDGRPTKERLRGVAQAIHDSGADILVTSAALARFEPYYITALRPAPLIIGFVQGPPPQFAPPNLDWGLAWSLHPMLETPVDCTRLHMDVDLPDREQFIAHQRSEFDLPDDAVVAATAGRHVKFQEPKFWQMVIELLREHPRLHYLALGVEEAQVPFLASMLTPEHRERIRFLGWRGDDYMRALCATDLFIDTFPSGGGTTILDALALGVPVVAFKNNYMRPYDQTDWSPAEELFDLDELLVERGNFAEMKRVVGRLIEDDGFRREAARLGEEQVRQTRGDPARGVRNCEEIYLRVLKEKLRGGSKAVDPFAAEIEELSPKRSFRLPRWAAWPVGQLKRALRFGERVLDRVA